MLAASRPVMLVVMLAAWGPQAAPGAALFRPLPPGCRKSPPGCRMDVERAPPCLHRCHLFLRGGGTAGRRHAAKLPLDALASRARERLGVAENRVSPPDPSEQSDEERCVALRVRLTRREAPSAAPRRVSAVLGGYSLSR